MNSDQHLSALESRRSEVKAAIVDEEHRPQPDSLRLASLKKQNLKLKEEIGRLFSEQGAVHG